MCISFSFFFFLRFSLHFYWPPKMARSPTTSDTMQRRNHHSDGSFWGETPRGLNGRGGAVSRYWSLETHTLLRSRPASALLCRSEAPVREEFSVGRSSVARGRLGIDVLPRLGFNFPSVWLFVPFYCHLRSVSLAMWAAPLQQGQQTLAGFQPRCCSVTSTE